MRGDDLGGTWEAWKDFFGSKGTGCGAFADGTVIERRLGDLGGRVQDVT